MVIDREVNGGLEGHSLQRGVNGVALVQGLPEQSPWHYRPTGIEEEVITVKAGC